MKTSSVVFILSISFIFFACNEEQPTPADLLETRPVTVLETEEREFSRETHLTGSVSLYREEQVGFEVSGRVLWVLDEGKEVEGPAFDADGLMVRPGEIIAQVDDTRYRLRVEAFKARLVAVQKALEVTQAELNLARRSLSRQKKVFRDGASSQQALDNAQRDFDSAAALEAQRRAEISEISENLKQAEEDLADCNLLAPFSGRITRIHVSQGAVVEAGMPVVTLSLMDPIQVQVAVSADEDRRILTGDRAVLYPKNPYPGEAFAPQVNAIVYDRGAVADSDTRTFQINLMARNERLRIDRIAPETKDLPLVEDFLPVVRRFQGDTGRLFVRTDSIYREGDRTFVLRLPGVSFHTDASRSAFGRHVPDKIEISLGNEYLTVIKWNFQSVEESQDLREGDFLVIDPRREHLEGLAIAGPQWLLRPGELVPVHFLTGATPKGIYVPVNAITQRQGLHVVFTVEEQKARLRKIAVHETYRELRRITGEDIAPGMEIIVQGVHFISEGQPVNVVGREKLNP